MYNFTKKTIREIALESPATVPVFEEYKIDFCCGGNRDFSEACETAGVSPDVLSEKLYEVLNDRRDETTDYSSASELIDHIVDKHHVFTRNEIARLSVLIEKVCRKHRAAHPELCFLENEFFALCDELMPHMAKEENVLFPFIRHMEICDRNDLSSPIPPFGTVQNPVRMMMTEHDAAGDILKRMRGLARDYAAPEDACPSFQALYFGLEALEKDLHRHIHLENNLLFPQAIELEGRVLSVCG